MIELVRTHVSDNAEVKHELAKVQKKIM